MTNEQRVRLWDAINRFADAPRLSVTRQKEVAEIESMIRELEAASREQQVKEGRNTEKE